MNIFYSKCKERILKEYNITLIKAYDKDESKKCPKWVQNNFISLHKMDIRWLML